MLSEITMYINKRKVFFFSRKKTLRIKMSVLDELVADFEQMDANEVTKRNCLTNSNISSIAKLKDSSTYEQIMTKIQFHREHKQVTSMETTDSECSLIIEATNFLGEIDDEIDLIHQFVKTIYRKRFFELDQIIQLPIDYLRTVQVRIFSSVCQLICTIVVRLCRNWVIIFINRRTMKIYEHFYLLEQY